MGLPRWLPPSRPNTRLRARPQSRRGRNGEDPLVRRAPCRPGARGASGCAAALLLVLLAALCIGVAHGHGHITWPHARNNGSIATGGHSPNYEAFWFSQPTTIPGEPTLPAYARTMNLGVDGGPDDFTRAAPWRAPGSAPVRGSGCGVAGGGPKAARADTADDPPPGYRRGDDFMLIPPTPPQSRATWARGSVCGYLNMICCRVSGHDDRLTLTDHGPPLTRPVAYFSPGGPPSCAACAFA